MLKENKIKHVGQSEWKMGAVRTLSTEGRKFCEALKRCMGRVK